uniref:Protein kinase domain-containing protein n=1 Tax=Phasianus colchicus TaxID=9054 RepID=A0A669QMD5_PHACC
MAQWGNRVWNVETHSAMLCCAVLHHGCSPAAGRAGTAAGPLCTAPPRQSCSTSAAGTGGAGWDLRGGGGGAAVTQCPSLRLDPDLPSAVPARTPPFHGETSADRTRMEAEQSTGQHQEIPHAPTPTYSPNPWGSILLSPQGAFGSCYQLMELATGRVYAAKVIPRARLSMPGTRERVEHELELHSRLCHRHVVRLHGHFSTHSHLYLLLEHCGRGSIADILRARGVLTEPEVRYYLQQVIAGLCFLHGHSIVHRDIKPSNLLVTEEMQVKIGDLGLARVVAGGRQHWGALCGTPGYLAPEVLERKGHGLPSDVWALGCVMYTVLTGSPPFGAAERQELYQRIRAVQYPLPSCLSARAQALLTQLLAPEPTARPNLQDVLDHSFFSQGFTPATLPPHACHTVPILSLLWGWLCHERRAAATSSSRRSSFLTQT